MTSGVYKHNKTLDCEGMKYLQPFRPRIFYFNFGEHEVQMVLQYYTVFTLVNGHLSCNFSTKTFHPLNLYTFRKVQTPRDH